MLFSEELGIVLEVLPKNVDRVTSAFTALKLPCVLIGHTTVEKEVNVSVGTYIREIFST
jgi:selenophosphate synthetase-related protein